MTDASMLIGPVLPCGCFTPTSDCPYLRWQLSRSCRQKPMPCSWMTDNGFTSRPDTLDTFRRATQRKGALSR